MHWAAVVSPSVITMATVASIFCAQRRELRRLRKEAKEVQRKPLAERDAHDVAELELRYDALIGYSSGFTPNCCKLICLR